MLAILLLLGAAGEDSALPPVRDRADRVDCELEPGVCYGMDVLRDCTLGPGVCIRLGIEEADPPKPKKPAKQPRKIGLNIYPPCGVDAAAWAAPRLSIVTKQIERDGSTVSLRTYQPCDKANPRIDVVLLP